MKRCTICKKPYRSGSIVTVVAAGKAKSVRACASCAKKAVLVYAADGQSACRCGAPATTCAGCANASDRKDRAKAVAGAVKKLRGILKAFEARNPNPSDEVAGHVEGHVTGLVQAIDVLEAGDF